MEKTESQVEKLKSLLHALRQKQDKSLAELTEKFSQALRHQTALYQEEKEENSLLQGQIKALRDKLVQLENNCRELEKNRKFEGMDPSAAEQVRQLESRLEQECVERRKNECLLQESRKHAEQLERATQFLRERAEAANLELDQLRSDFQNIQTSFDECDDQLKNARTENDQLQNHNKNLDRLEQELSRVKQTLIRALRESQELELQHQSVVEEKVGLIAKCRQLQAQRDLFNASLDSEKAQNMELREQASVWQRECEQAKKEAADNFELQKVRLEEEKALVRQREASILDLQRQVGLLRHEGEKARDELALIADEISAKEKEMQEAQQHLARKVKEVAELEIRSEAKQRHNEELQQLLNDSKVRIAELQTSCEMHEAQNERMQAQLQEAIKAYETQQAKWEDKYLALHEKWQAAEGRLKDLEKLEERYKQLQGFFFMPAASPELIAESIKEPAPVKEPPTPTHPPAEAPKNFANLFDLPKSSNRAKQNLLD